MTTSAAPAAPAPPYKRSVKNYLIDRRFQLKYTSYILVVAVVISGILGAFLVYTSNAVVAESRKVSDVVRMQIKDDPIYGSNPELLKAYTSQADEGDAKVAGQQRMMLGGIVGGLGLMCVFLGLTGIVVTHKMVGPLYKMKMLLRQVGDGKLNYQGKVRKGDEFQDFFEVFADMVVKLKERQRNEVEELTVAVELAKKSGADAEALQRIEAVRDEMRAALER